MADIPAGGQIGAPGRIKDIGTLTNWAGAAVSLALIFGVGVWGYRTLARDVSGVPVVRAASGLPMRVLPDDPGGSPALNQGLAVNSVAAEGAAEAPADRLILAPAPVDLTEQDLPMGAAVTAMADAALAPVTQSAPAQELSPQMASIRALAEQLSAGAAPLEKNEPAIIQPEEAEETAAIAAEAEPEPAVVADTPKIKGGLKHSLRPMPRPAGLKAVEPMPAVASPIEVAAVEVPVGTRLVQLGAFESPEIARREWDRLATKFEDYLEGKQRVIQKAQSGGRTFFRLRAIGFADLNDARRFCSALLAERAECIPVTTR